MQEGIYHSEKEDIFLAVSLPQAKLTQHKMKKG